MVRSVNEMRLDQADYARDAKKEAAMCAMGTCTGNPYEKAPDGWGTGRYGGRHLCKSCYRDVVDKLAESIINGDGPYWEEDD